VSPLFVRMQEIVETQPAGGARQMAADEFLLAEAQEPCLAFFYLGYPAGNFRVFRRLSRSARKTSKQKTDAQMDGRRRGFPRGRHHFFARDPDLFASRKRKRRGNLPQDSRVRAGSPIGGGGRCRSRRIRKRAEGQRLLRRSRSARCRRGIRKTRGRGNAPHPRGLALPGQRPRRIRKPARASERKNARALLPGKRTEVFLPRRFGRNRANRRRPIRFPRMATNGGRQEILVLWKTAILLLQQGLANAAANRATQEKPSANRAKKPGKKRALGFATPQFSHFLPRSFLSFFPSEAWAFFFWSKTARTGSGK